MEAKCYVLFALIIACLGVSCVEGIRPLWSEPKSTERILTISIEANYKIELGEQSVQHNNVKRDVVKNQGSRHLGAPAYNDEEDFRPTTPGNSPGAGHKSSEVSEPKSVSYFTAGTKEDYRPTQPGHSPGVGHAQEKVQASP